MREKTAFMRASASFNHSRIGRIGCLAGKKSSGLDIVNIDLASPSAPRIASVFVSFGSFNQRLPLQPAQRVFQQPARALPSRANV